MATETPLDKWDDLIKSASAPDTKAIITAMMLLTHEFKQVRLAIEKLDPKRVDFGG